MNRIMAFLGLATIMFLAFLLSENRRAISISQIIWAFTLQGLLALFVLREDLISKSIMLFFLFLLFYYNTHKTINSKIQNVFLRHFTAISTFAIFTLMVSMLQTNIIKIAFYIFYFILFLYFTTKLFIPKQTTSLKMGCIFGAVFCLLSAGYSISSNTTGAMIVELFASGVTRFINFNRAGGEFVFGSLFNMEKMGFVFVLFIFSSTIYFGAMMALFDYLGITYAVVGALAGFMKWHMQLFKVKPLSGVEMLVATANIVVSMITAPLLVKKYLPNVTQSEIATMMLTGLATVAGSTMAIFIGMGIPAGYMLAASVMSTPAAILLAKMLIPETKDPETLGTFEIKESGKLERQAGGALSAITNGVGVGVRTGAAITASVMAFLGIIALINWIFASADAFIDGHVFSSLFGNVHGVLPYKGIVPASLTDFFRLMGKPFAMLLGVERGDSAYVGELLALKLAANEAIAYARLLEIREFISERSMMISTYALCGFANFGSLGILLGAMNGVCPERSGDFAKFGLRSVFFGAFASWMTAAFAALFI